MKYRIIYLENSEYCQLKPSDQECHHTYTVNASNYIEAVRMMYQEIGGFDALQKNITPMVWTYTVDKS